MALRAKVLQKKAEKFELKKLEVIKVTKEGISYLDDVLLEVYASRHPKPIEYEVRTDLIRVFNEIAKEIYGNSKDIPVVVEFGSFVMDLFSTTSDLDLSVNFGPNAVDFPREKKIQTLRKFARKLYAIQSMGHVSGVLPITTAKVPILKCVDRGTGVECDISVENRDGISKSHLIRIISSIDERFKKLSFLMKTWAKAHNINSSKDKTLNSLSIILLVAFHLQTRNPPILPPFSAIFKDGNDPATVAESIAKFVNYGKQNRESLAELFVTLLLKLSSVEKLWPKGLCASTCTASWTSKTWGNSKVGCISVEDFTDNSQNVARAVGPAEVKQIHKCINISIGYISAFMDGQTGLKLKDILFGVDGKTIGIPNLNQIAPFPCMPSQANHSRGLTGKRKKKPMRPGPSFQNRMTHMENHPGTESANGNEAKKMRTAGSWRGGSGPAAHVGGQLTTPHAVPTNIQSQQVTAGCGEMYAGGWERSLQPAAGGWGQIEQPRAGGWGQIEQPRTGGWERSKQPAAGGWGQIEQPRAGGWGQIEQPGAGSWGQIEQSGTGGWEEAYRGGGCGGWGESQPNGWGAMQQQQSNGGWGAMQQQQSSGGWGAIQQQLNNGGWGGAQQHYVAQPSTDRLDTYPRRF